MELKRWAKKAGVLLLACVMAASLIDPNTADSNSPEAVAAAPQRIRAVNESSDCSLSPAYIAKQHKRKRMKRSRRNRNQTLSWVQLAKRYPGSFITAGSRQKRRIALTFDDVPDPRYTPKILDVLARYRTRATFFVVGSRASAYPAIVWRMKREGHAIGNHSYNHAVFSRLSMPAFQNQIRRTDGILRYLIGYSPRFIRPPYGEVVPGQVEWLRSHGFIVVNWDVDSVDWRSIDSSSILFNIGKTLQPGSIILQHAGGGAGQDLSGTINALPRLIQLLRSKGYELVTIPELLGRPESRSR